MKCLVFSRGIISLESNHDGLVSLHDLHLKNRDWVVKNINVLVNVFETHLFDVWCNAAVELE